MVKGFQFPFSMRRDFLLSNESKSCPSPRYIVLVDIMKYDSPLHFCWLWCYSLLYTSTWFPLTSSWYLWEPWRQTHIPPIAMESLAFIAFRSLFPDIEKVWKHDFNAPTLWWCTVQSPGEKHHCFCERLIKDNIKDNHWTSPFTIQKYNIQWEN